MTVIRHGYHGSTDGCIELRIRAPEGGPQFRVRNAGDPPDPARICAREAAVTKSADWERT